MQAIYAGRKATLSIGNIKPIGEMPEGAIICNVEEVSYPCVPAVQPVLNPTRKLRQVPHHSSNMPLTCL